MGYPTDLLISLMMHYFHICDVEQVYGTMGVFCNGLSVRLMLCHCGGRYR